MRFPHRHRYSKTKLLFTSTLVAGVLLWNVGLSQTSLNGNQNYGSGCWAPRPVRPSTPAPTANQRQTPAVTETRSPLPGSTPVVQVSPTVIQPTATVGSPTATPIAAATPTAGGDNTLGPAIISLSDRMIDAEVGQPLPSPMVVRAKSGGMVTFQALDGGAFPNGQDKLTVQADPEGRAEAQFTETEPGTFHVQASCPQNEGHILFYVLARPAGTAKVGLSAEEKQQQLEWIKKIQAFEAGRKGGSTTP